MAKAPDFGLYEYGHWIVSDPSVLDRIQIRNSRSKSLRLDHVIGQAFAARMLQLFVRLQWL